MKNAGATTRPWLTDCSSAPCAPWSVSEKIPSVMKPSWATDEYPRISRVSVVVNAIAEP